MSLEGHQLGRYRLQHPLGSGGMGEVYLATDTSLNRQVAIKVIRAEAASYPEAQAAQEAARLPQEERSARGARRYRGRIDRGGKSRISPRWGSVKRPASPGCE